MKRLSLLVAMAIITVSACSGDGKKNTPPLANAGEDRTVSVEQLVELDGSLSSDSDGDRLSYEWTLLSQPEGSTPLFADTDSAHPIFIAYEKGDYWFSLRVFDGGSWSEPDQVQITAEASGFEPTAKINVVPENPKAREPVYVSGKASTDPNNDPLNFYWQVVSAPEEIDLDQPIRRSFFFTPMFGKGSLYKFSLFVKDPKDYHSRVNVDILIGNSPPKVDAGDGGELRDWGTGEYHAVLSAAGSDLDNDQLTYEWTVFRAVAGSNPIISDPTIRNPTFTVDRLGFYVLKVRAFDGSAWSVPDYVTYCKGNGCPDERRVSLTPDRVYLHPVYNPIIGKYVAQFPTSQLTYTIPEDASEIRWIVINCPTGVEVGLSDIQNPLNSTMLFTGDINMGSMISECQIRLEADNGGYTGDYTYIKSSFLTVYFRNSIPVIPISIPEEILVHYYDPTKVFQRIPLSITAEDPDSDTLTYYWSIVSKPLAAQAFFSSDSNRPDPILYAGKERDALGTYKLRAIVEDTLGGSSVKDITLAVVE